MVLYIILPSILLVSCIFPRPFGARLNARNRLCPAVEYIEVSNSKFNQVLQHETLV